MRRMVGLVAVLAAVVTGCAGQDAAPGARPSAASPTDGATSGAPATEVTTAPSVAETPQASGVTVRAAPSAYGRMLFDRDGQAIYLFDKESTRRPECYGGCAEAWPPVLTEGSPEAAAGVRPGLLGTTQRRDGTTQVTYGGHPLYYYAHEGPNQVLCHDVVEFGGRWLVVTPAGRAAA
jgi:predicted lipoprotein with Yx(FWY)xxD motif